jgi:PAS domain-containing protein
MSVATTHPDIPASVQSTPNTWLLGRGSHSNVRDGAVVNGSRPIERRRNGTCGDSPIDILTRMPAVVVLERLPIPSLAMARDGVIMFANTAFAEMVGYEQGQLARMVFPEAFHTVPAAVCGLSGVDTLAHLVVELRHFQGWTVRARMSRSVLMRRDDPVSLVTFEDLTDRLWDE